MTSRAPVLLVLVGLALAGCERDRAPSPAAATDLPAILPARSDAVVHVALRALRPTRAWALVETLTEPQRPQLDAVARACGLAPLDRIDAVTLVGDGVRPGLSFAVVEGRFTAAELHRCFGTMMDTEVTATVRDGITELASPDLTASVYLHWIRDGLVLIPYGVPTDRGYLAGLLDGPRLTTGPLAEPLRAAAGGGAPVWAVAAGDEQRGVPALMQPIAYLAGPVPPRRARATLGFADGVVGELRLGFESEAEAGNAERAARQAIGALAADPTLAAFAPLVTATSLEVRGAELTLSLAAGDAALASAIAELAGGLALIDDEVDDAPPVDDEPAALAP